MIETILSAGSVAGIIALWYKIGQIEGEVKQISYRLQNGQTRRRFKD